MKVYIIRSSSSLDHEGSADVHSAYLNKEDADFDCALLQSRAELIREKAKNPSSRLTSFEGWERWNYYEVEEEHLFESRNPDVLVIEEY